MCSHPSSPLATAAQWLGSYQQFWTESFDRLDAHVQEMKRAEQTGPEETARGRKPARRK